MGKFHGVVGYAIPNEIRPGVYKDSYVEREARGDVIEFTGRWANGIAINDNYTTNTKISIVADAFAYEHFSKIKYCIWMGVKWKVLDVKIPRPRIIMTLGGEFNGGKATTT